LKASGFSLANPTAAIGFSSYTPNWKEIFQMSLLKSLKFVAMPAKKAADPVQEARSKLIGRLEVQSRLASDPQWSTQLKRWRKNRDTGKREPVNEVGRPRPMWMTAADGSTVFFVRRGRVGFVEFSKGCQGIAVKSEAELPEVIGTLIAAVKAGEIDSQLMKAKHK
jgi:hypothetical protein